MGLIITISQISTATVWRGGTSFPESRSLLGDRMSLRILTVHTVPRRSRRATLVLRLQEARSIYSPFPNFEEGIPGLVIPSPEFLYLTANKEVTDALYKTRIYFLNQIIQRFLNSNPIF